MPTPMPQPSSRSAPASAPPWATLSAAHRPQPAQLHRPLHPARRTLPDPARVPLHRPADGRADHRAVLLLHDRRAADRLARRPLPPQAAHHRRRGPLEPGHAGHRLGPRLLDLLHPPGAWSASARPPSASSPPPCWPTSIPSATATASSPSSIWPFPSARPSATWPAGNWARTGAGARRSSSAPFPASSSPRSTGWLGREPERGSSDHIRAHRQSHHLPRTLPQPRLPHRHLRPGHAHLRHGRHLRLGARVSASLRRPLGGQLQPGRRRHHGRRRHRRNPHRRLDRPALAAHQPPRALPALLLERRAHPALRRAGLLRPAPPGPFPRSLPPSSSSSSTPARSTPPSSTRSPRRSAPPPSPSISSSFTASATPFRRRSSAPSPTAPT